MVARRRGIARPTRRQALAERRRAAAASCVPPGAQNAWDRAESECPPTPKPPTTRTD